MRGLEWVHYSFPTYNMDTSETSFSPDIVDTNPEKETPLQELQNLQQQLAEGLSEIGERVVRQRIAEIEDTMSITVLEERSAEMSDAA